MHGRRVLVIDDDRDFVELIRLTFEAAGAIADTALSAEQGLLLFRERHHDLVVMDLKMPGMDGCQACKAFRQLSSVVPIIMLTAMGSNSEVVRCLDAGADDYLVKPFDRQVLKARARAALRRADLSPKRSGPLAYQDDHLAFDLARREVSVRGQPVKLTNTEYGVLECLVCNADHLMTVRQILECVWGPQYVDSIAYVHVYVHRLRQKLEPDPEEPRYLLNMPGSGYLFRTEGASARQS
jgi:two-component system KDP operon response regulator KdpE